MDKDSYTDYCYDQLVDKQRQWSEQYAIGDYDRYWYDQVAELLQFKNNGIVEISFLAFFIGTWSSRSNTWKWGWANESFTEDARNKTATLRTLSQRFDTEIFEQEMIDGDSEMAQELVAIAIEELGCIGMYRCPGERSDLYVGVKQSVPNPPTSND